MAKILSYSRWGSDIDPGAILQMDNACKVPVAIAAALMPDAHPGYGLPIGGVLATKNAVIPYAVGVDIGCRVMLSVLDLPVSLIKQNKSFLINAIEDNTRFGIGAHWNPTKDHPVLERDWNLTQLTKEVFNTAKRQLGTSGSGNHFVEIGILEILCNWSGLALGEYFAIVSHSGSRGAGARVADYYSKLAQRLHPELSNDLKHLAWLDMCDQGAEYWSVMELMGDYASANHHIIHDSIIRYLGTNRLAMVENHHNFAWRENHFGQDLIVHRKGATPAGKGVFGFVPGTMTDPGYVVEGNGELRSLNSCSHGAGRKISRNHAKREFSLRNLKEDAERKGVTLISAGVDEISHAYKDINKVMSEQSDLVKIIARFTPKIVKMAPEGERSED